ncbi:MAG: hypothetical protein LBC74_02825 [Planctomycetaceae bacterium]|nr:hypothetical protein [Planctomycetaceae bacterium]
MDLRNFNAYFKIDWAADNNIGLVEADFSRSNPADELSIFFFDADRKYEVGRYSNQQNQYRISVDRNMGGQIAMVTSNFYLKAATGPNTETKLIESAEISILPFPSQFINMINKIKYRIITDRIRENLDDNAHGTEGRYLVPNSTINVIRATTLFGDKCDKDLTGITYGKSDAPTDNGINWNDIHQGQTGDCYFLVCLMALAKDNKNFIKNHLQEVTEGNPPVKKYKVYVYDKGNQMYVCADRVEKLFTHGISQVKLSGDYMIDNNGKMLIEVWPQVYEKAWSYIRNDAKTFGDIDGGNVVEVWKKITNKETRWKNLAGAGNDVIWEEILSHLSPTSYIIISTKEKLGDLNKSLYEDGIEPVDTHVYLVDYVDMINRKVKLLNPHGFDHVLQPYDELSKVVRAIFILEKP